MEKDKDSLTILKFLLVLLAAFAGLWLLKLILNFALTLALSVLTVGLYLLAAYIAVILIMKLLVVFLQEKKPAFAVSALKFHGRVIRHIKSFLKSISNFLKN